MKAKLIRHLAPLLVSAFVFLSSLWASLRYGWETFIGRGVMDPVFADLRQITSAASCISEDPDWTVASDSCDPFGRQFNYPSLIARVLAFMGIGYEHSGVLGASLLLVFAASVGLILYLLQPSSGDIFFHSASIAAVISPPVWLLLERGNSDIFVLFLLCLGLALAAGKGYPYAMVPLMLATVLKAFPFAALVVFFSRGRRGIILVSVFTAVVAGYVALTWDEWMVAVASTPRPVDGGFGVTAAPDWVSEWFGLQTNTAVSHSAGLAVLASSLALIVFGRSRAIRDVRAVIRLTSERLANVRMAKYFFVGSSAVVISVYLLGSSWDYRLVFLIPVVVALSSIGSPLPKTQVFVWLITCSMWLSYLSTPFFQFVGDIILAMVLPVLILITFHLAIAGAAGVTLNNGPRVALAVQSRLVRALGL